MKGAGSFVFLATYLVRPYTDLRLTFGRIRPNPTCKDMAVANPHIRIRVSLMVIRYF